MSSRRSWKSLIVFMAIVFGISLTAQFFTEPRISTWYHTLKLPGWTPPDWVFAPVWTVLYITIALTGWLIYHSPQSKERSRALTYYALQLVFNFSWSFAFFYCQSILGGLIVMMLLWDFVFLTIKESFRVHPPAAYLFIPYGLWITYALFLNFAILYLNR